MRVAFTLLVALISATGLATQAMGQNGQESPTHSIAIVDLGFHRTSGRSCALSRQEDKSVPDHGQVVYELLKKRMSAVPKRDWNVYCFSLGKESGHGYTNVQLCKALAVAFRVHPEILNLSLETRELSQCVSKLFTKFQHIGTQIVVAAGNTWGLGASALTDAPDILAIGALAENGEPAQYSARINVNCWAFGEFRLRLDGTVQIFKGTSIAAIELSAKLLRQSVTRGHLTRRFALRELCMKPLGKL